MNKNNIICILLCLMSSSAWSMKRVNNESNDAKRVKVSFLQEGRTVQERPEQYVEVSPVNQLFFLINSRSLSPLVKLEKTAALLRQHYVDINVAWRFGATFLHYACLRGDRDVVKLLISNKAAVDARTLDGRTPLHIAAQLGSKEICSELLGNKAMVNAQTIQGATPLHLAAQQGHKDVCELLLANHAIVDARFERAHRWRNINFGRFTALHVAVYYNKREIVMLLCEGGANIHALTEDGRTAGDIARQLGHEGILTYLERRAEGEHFATLAEGITPPELEPLRTYEYTAEELLCSCTLLLLK